MADNKPRYLVLGGVGFIGRNFVQHLVENNIAAKIRVVDKVLPATAFLTPAQKAAFEHVEFKQGNLVNPSPSCETRLRPRWGHPNGHTQAAHSPTL